jgi:hypothetical protein
VLRHIAALEVVGGAPTTLSLTGVHLITCMTCHDRCTVTVLCAMFNEFRYVYIMSLTVLRLPPVRMFHGGMGCRLYLLGGVIRLVDMLYTPVQHGSFGPVLGGVRVY